MSEDLSHLTRRQLLWHSATGALALALAPGCGLLSQQDKPPQDSPPTTRATTTLPPTCSDPTADNIEGPYFLAQSPQTGDLRQELAGTPLRLQGRVLSTDCQPLEGVQLDFWQADEAGGYDLEGYRLRGHQFSDAQGAWTLETILPGHYLNGKSYRPAHIHVKLEAPGLLPLTTQLYFQGDPYNADDDFIHPSLIMRAREQDDGLLLARFDFVLEQA